MKGGISTYPVARDILRDNLSVEELPRAGVMQRQPSRSMSPTSPNTTKSNAYFPNSNSATLINTRNNAISPQYTVKGPLEQTVKRKTSVSDLIGRLTTPTTSSLNKVRSPGRSGSGSQPLRSPKLSSSGRRTVSQSEVVISRPIPVPKSMNAGMRSLSASSPEIQLASKRKAPSPPKSEPTIEEARRAVSNPTKPCIQSAQSSTESLAGTVRSYNTPKLDNGSQFSTPGQSKPPSIRRVAKTGATESPSKSLNSAESRSDKNSPSSALNMKPMAYMGHNRRLSAPAPAVNVTTPRAMSRAAPKLNKHRVASPPLSPESIRTVDFQKVAPSPSSSHTSTVIEETKPLRQLSKNRSNSGNASVSPSARDPSTGSLPSAESVLGNAPSAANVPSENTPPFTSLDPAAPLPSIRAIDPAASQTSLRSLDPAASQTSVRSLDPAASQTSVRSLDLAVSQTSVRSLDPAAASPTSNDRVSAADPPSSRAHSSENVSPVASVLDPTNGYSPTRIMDPESAPPSTKSQSVAAQHSNARRSAGVSPPNPPSSTGASPSANARHSANTKPTIRALDVASVSHPKVVPPASNTSAVSRSSSNSEDAPAPSADGKNSTQEVVFLKEQNKKLKAANRLLKLRLEEQTTIQEQASTELAICQASRNSLQHQVNGYESLQRGMEKKIEHLQKELTKSKNRLIKLRAHIQELKFSLEEKQFENYNLNRQFTRDAVERKAAVQGTTV